MEEFKEFTADLNWNQIKDGKRFIKKFELLALEKWKRNELTNERFLQILRIFHYLCFRDLKDEAEREWIVLDLDGCLCSSIFSDKNNKENAIIWKNKSTEEKREKYRTMQPFKAGIEVIQGLSKIFNICIATGRCQKYFNETMEWLDENLGQDNYHMLHMWNDEWEQIEEYLGFKETVIKTYRRKTVLVIDDDLAVLKVASNLGLPTFHVMNERDWDFYRILDLVPFDSRVIREILF